MSFEEYANTTMTSSSRSTFDTFQQCEAYSFEPQTIRKEVDWRGKAVSAVQDQGSCGSCWAFATIGTIEGAYARKMDWNMSLIGDNGFSEQQLVDCETIDAGYEAKGCSGGRPDWALNYALENGVQTESSYPYVGYTQSGYHYYYYNGSYHYENTFSQCDETEDRIKPDGCYYIKPNDEYALKVAVDTMGPVAVSINSSYKLHHYGSGILGGDYDCDSSSYADNHAVLVVGYTQEYWIVKNSWGQA